MLVTRGVSAPPARSALSSASMRWKVGWALGGAVVVVSAGLLLAIIGYARRIARQADEITAALKATQRNTAPLFDLVRVNGHLDRIAAPPAEQR
jgi:hypothetical protein